MELGYKKLDDKEQKTAKRSFNFSVGIRKVQFYFLVAMLAIGIVMTIVFGVMSITDETKVRMFKACGIITIIIVLGFLFGHLLMKLIEYLVKKQNQGDVLPDVSERTLKSTLNYMRGNIGGLIWDIMWGIIAFSALVVSLPNGLFKEDINVRLRTTILVSIVIFIVGHIFFKIMHKRRDLTSKMLKQTKKFYDYDDAEKYAEYVDWSLRDNMLLRCRQVVLTKEVLLGYANTDCYFIPVAVPREYIDEAEFREVLSTNSKASYCDGVLACRLKNGKVIDFYLSRGIGNKQVCDLLIKYDFPFTIRTDTVEYK